MLKSILALLLSVIFFSCDNQSGKTTPAEFASAAASAQSLRTQVAAVAPSTPPLVIKEGQLIEVGEIYENASTSYSFTISNTSTEPLQLDMISGTCNCIVVENNLADYVLPAKQEVSFNLTLVAAKIPVGEFVRDSLVEVPGYLPMKIVFRGKVKPLLVIPPAPQIDFGLLKDSAQKWSKTVAVELQPEVTGVLSLPTEIAHNLFAVALGAVSERKVEITVSPKEEMPYTQEFSQTIRIPVLQPAGCPSIELVVSGQVGGKIFFSPSAYNFTRATLRSAPQHTVSYYLGEVELTDGTVFSTPVSKSRHRLGMLRRTHTATPPVAVNYNLKETIDWETFFANLAVDVPNGVKVEKIKHEFGIELKVTVNANAFARGRKVLHLRPRRGKQYFNNLLLTALEIPEDDEQEDEQDEEE